MSERSPTRYQRIELPFRESLPKIQGIEAIETDATKLKVIYQTLYWIQEIVVGLGICPPLVGALGGYKIGSNDSVGGNVARWEYNWAAVLGTGLLNLEVKTPQLNPEHTEETPQPNPEDIKERKRSLLSSIIFNWLDKVYQRLANGAESDPTLTSMIVLAPYQMEVDNSELDDALSQAKLSLYKALIDELRNNRGNLENTRVFKILNTLISTGLAGDSINILRLKYYLETNITNLLIIPNEILANLESFALHLSSNPQSPLWVLYQIVDVALNPAIFYGNALTSQDLATFPIADPNDPLRNRQKVLSLAPHPILSINHLTNPLAAQYVSPNRGDGIRLRNTGKAHALLQERYEEWIMYIKQIPLPLEES